MRGKRHLVDYLCLPSCGKICCGDLAASACGSSRLILFIDIISMALKYSNARLLVRFIPPAPLNPFDTEFAGVLGIKFNSVNWVNSVKIAL